MSTEPSGQISLSPKMHPTCKSVPDTQCKLLDGFGFFSKKPKSLAICNLC